MRRVGALGLAQTVPDRERREFGGKHHTTVLHSISKIGEMRKLDRDLNRLINKLTDSLN